MKITAWIALGNGQYRVFGTQGPDGGFCAEVSIYEHDGWVCNVLRCNNHAINAWELSGRCIEAICN
jgi:hypothetical protein